MLKVHSSHFLKMCRFKAANDPMPIFNASLSTQECKHKWVFFLFIFLAGAAAFQFTPSFDTLKFAVKVFHLRRRSRLSLFSAKSVAMGVVCKQKGAWLFQGFTLAQYFMENFEPKSCWLIGGVVMVGVCNMGRLGAAQQGRLQHAVLLSVHPQSFSHSEATATFYLRGWSVVCEVASVWLLVLFWMQLLWICACYTGRSTEENSSRYQLLFPR